MKKSKRVNVHRLTVLLASVVALMVFATLPLILTAAPDNVMAVKSEAVYAQEGESRAGNLISCNTASSNNDNNSGEDENKNNGVDPSNLGGSDGLNGSEFMTDGQQWKIAVTVVSVLVAAGAAAFAIVKIIRTKQQTEGVSLSPDDGIPQERNLTEVSSGRKTAFVESADIEQKGTVVCDQAVSYPLCDNVVASFGYQENKNQFVDSVDAETGLATVVEYDKSFAAKLIQSSEEIKWYYAVLKNLLMNFKKSISFVTWQNESISYGKNTIAKFDVEGDELILYLALNPDEFADKKPITDKSMDDAYWEVPCMCHIVGADGVEVARELIFALAKKYKLHRGEDRYVDYHVEYRTTQQLLSDGLIRKKQQEVGFVDYVKQSMSSDN